MEKEETFYDWNKDGVKWRERGPRILQGRNSTKTLSHYLPLVTNNEGVRMESSEEVLDLEWVRHKEASEESREGERVTDFITLFKTWCDAQCIDSSFCRSLSSDLVSRVTVWKIKGLPKVKNKQNLQTKGKRTCQPGAKVWKDWIEERLNLCVSSRVCNVRVCQESEPTQLLSSISLLSSSFSLCDTKWTSKHNLPIPSFPSYSLLIYFDPAINFNDDKGRKKWRNERR